MRLISRLNLIFETKNLACETSLREVSQFYSPCGEFYCFAVIFGFRRVVFASQVLEANKITLKPKGFNNTIAIRQ